MKNVTISIDDETYKAARIYAAASGTSVSALVKQYLAALTSGAQVDVKGVREMPMGYITEPNLAPIDAALPPGAYGLTPEGKPYYTKDGKPRKPGALRGKIFDLDESDDWKQGIIDAMYGDDTEAANTWWLDANEVMKNRAKK
jgi:hypothetical protein